MLSARKKSIELLEELGLPNGLFPLENIEDLDLTTAKASFSFFRTEKDHIFNKIE